MLQNHVFHLQMCDVSWFMFSFTLCLFLKVLVEVCLVVVLSRFVLLCAFDLDVLIRAVTDTVWFSVSDSSRLAVLTVWVPSCETTSFSSWFPNYSLSFPSPPSLFSHNFPCSLSCLDRSHTAVWPKYTLWSGGFSTLLPLHQQVLFLRTASVLSGRTRSCTRRW